MMPLHPLDKRSNPPEKIPDKHAETTITNGYHQTITTPTYTNKTKFNNVPIPNTAFINIKNIAELPLKFFTAFPNDM